MDNETKTTASQATAADAVVEKETLFVLEKEAPPKPEAELGKVENIVVEEEDEKKAMKLGKIDESFLVDPEKKALDELKVLIREALIKHEFTPPPSAKDENKKEDEPKKQEMAEVVSPPLSSETVKQEAAVVDKFEEKLTLEAVDTKADESVEEIKETIIHEVSTPAEETVSVPAKEKKSNDEETDVPLPPEVVSIWGIALLADEKSDVILLKFLRARDFKVKEAFSMLKNVVSWRKEFKIEHLLEEEFIIEGLENVAYIHGVDKEGHPVSYNAFGEFQDKILYSNVLADAEKRAKFLKWYIQFLEKNIRKLDFSPQGISTIVQIIDLKNSPAFVLFKKELRQSTNQALQLLQDNYPEFVAKQIFVNVPWWYVTYNRLISPFLTQRTKSKFVFAGPTRTSETLFKYIAPEQLPVQYGGLDKKIEHQEFTPADPATEEIINPASKHTIEFLTSEVGTLVWEVRVVGWDVRYGVEFVPSAEGSYTWIVQKPRKISPSDEHQLIGSSFKITETGKIVLTLDNQTSKKKKVHYRFKAKSSS